MGLWDGIKAKLWQADKTEVDYGLEKLIVKAERLPIHFNWYDFHRGKLQPLDPVLGNLKEQRMEKRLAANKNRADDKIRKIHKIFAPVMETMKKDLLKEKDPERAERIAKEYRQVEKIVNDLETRVQRWLVAGDQILCCEYNVPTRRVLAQGIGHCRGIFTQGFYSRESLQNNIKALYVVEKNYEKYNNGRGLKALEKAAKEIDYWQRIHQEQWDNDLLTAQSKADEELDASDDLVVPEKQSRRRPIQARLGEIYREAEKGEATKTNSTKIQKFSR